MHSLPLLINIALALGYALLGGLVARRLGLPTIVGYLLAGVALGPFTPGFSGDIEAIQQLAELGVILLMFGIGLHFSLRDLWLVRDIAIPGAIVQMVLATGIGYWMAVNWGWSPQAALVLGVAISVASTVVLLRGLMDLGALDTPHGRVAVGWLVLEDLATVAILVLLPAVVSGDRATGWHVPALAIAKALAFIALMLSSERGSSPRSSERSPTHNRASCSSWSLSRPRSGPLWPPLKSLEYPSRSGRSSPAWWSANRRSATR